MSPSLASAAVILALQSGAVDIELPVVDLSYESASLDESVRTAESADEVELTLAADVLFQFDKASLSPKAQTRIDEVVARVRDASPARVLVDGYTDAKGSSPYNRRLSRRRAQAVAVALRRRGAPRLVVRGHGEADPVAPNTNKDGSDNPKGRARNRRVTITFPR
jgi:outer membrane protein OmpA-like peptidoglycan-associated protein